MIPAPREPAADGPTDPARGRAPDPATAREPDPATGWALAARDGDPAAQAAFVRATQAEVWRFAAALVDPDTADDLTQETYLRAFRALPAFAGRSSARTWLLGIARRACADHLRVVVRRRRLAERLASHAHTDLPHPDPAGQLGAADLVRRLPAERRGAFVLTQLLGLSYAEAAAVEGVPVGTIRSRVARARHDLVEAAGDALAG
ncbi:MULTISPECIES: sigma-70 family RNA polymerase sigma factor [Micromonospora]|uniref:RNA polymerase sigma factor n=1 Tax=Micromonospora haikouensis TaxID=686309 RepID=A0A0D0X7H8_9ACTN|nr:RNA polymerase sigma factor SigC [Micromonospora haikouensis]